MVSPLLTTTAPSACLANFPVSNRISSLPTAAVTDVVSGAIVLMMSSFFLAGDGGGGLRQVHSRARPEDLPQTSTRSPKWLAPFGAVGVRESRLPPEAEFLDQRAITLDIPLLQVVEEPAA